MKVVLALGANLGDPRKQISLAIDAIRDIVKPHPLKLMIPNRITSTQFSSVIRNYSPKN